MQIQLTNTGKRYNTDWIFRKINYRFLPGGRYAITGSNGSGKSTLLQVIAGAVLHNEGNLIYSLQGKDVAAEKAYRSISIAAPYLELIEEMNPVEFLRFHASFKNLTAPIADILQYVQLQHASEKQIRYFSSGMKQRLKLAQAVFSDTPVLLLDEPLTNLDVAGIELYHAMIQEHAARKLIIVSSNDPQEYSFCTEQLSIMDYKV